MPSLRGPFLEHARETASQRLPPMIYAWVHSGQERCWGWGEGTSEREKGGGWEGGRIERREREVGREGERGNRPNKNAKDVDCVGMSVFLFCLFTRLGFYILPCSIHFFDFNTYQN